MVNIWTLLLGDGESIVFDPTNLQGMDKFVKRGCCVGLLVAGKVAAQFPEPGQELCLLGYVIFAAVYHVTAHLLQGPIQ